MKKRTAQEYLLLAICLLTSIGILPFVVYRIVLANYITAAIDALIILGLLAIFYYLYSSRRVDKASYLIASICLTGITTVIHLNGVSHVYWVYPSVVAAFYVYPIGKALITSLVFSGIIFMLVVDKMVPDFLYTSVITVLITCGFAFVFAKKMSSQNNQLIESARLTDLRNKTLELMVSSKSLNEILNLIAINVEEEFPTMLCSILLLDQEKRHLRFGAGPSLPDFYNEAIDGLKIGKGVGSCGTAANNGERVVIDDINTHPYMQPYLYLTKKANLGACWSEPIKNSEGSVLGTFAIYHRGQSIPSEQDIMLIEQFAHLASIAIERENFNQVIWQQANFDSLTGLPNRNMMIEHLTKATNVALRDNTQVAVAFIDLDHFKDINDKLGHAVGDLLLVEVAKRIASLIRKTDTVARLGGDEFVIIFPDFMGSSSSATISENLLNSLSAPYHFHDEVIHTSASIGMTIFPDDAIDIENLLRNADQAMYCAKDAGRHSCYFFTDKMRALASARLELINDLRLAIENKEFFVVYQPIVDLANQRIDKVEALIRWQHPTKGLISPLEFISVAEETGLIIAISDYLFEEVLNQYPTWRQLNPNFQISVNTSPVQYKKHEGNIVNWLEKLELLAIDKDVIVLEITENLLMESHSYMEHVLKKVRRAGINIAIDDFGTGYSSFSYLREYTTDYLKIDQSFVHKMSAGNNDSVLCEAIIVMAKKLNIKVIAEGIETQEQQQLLTDFGCDYGQGYLFSKPVSAGKISELLKPK